MSDTDDVSFDIRVVKHHLRQRLRTQEELDAHLATLEDVADLGEPTTTVFKTAYQDRHYGEEANKEADKD